MLAGQLCGRVIVDFAGFGIEAVLHSVIGAARSIGVLNAILPETPEY